MVKAVIFDFDGTLADTREVLHNVYHKIAEKHGYKILSSEELETLKGLSVKERIRKLGMPLHKVPSLLKEGREMCGKYMDTCPAYPGIPELLSQLKEKGFFLGIVSSNSEKNIKTFLNAHGLDMVDNIATTSGLLGKHRIIARLLNNNGINKEEAVYVGDELRDINSCTKLPVRIIAVAWGYDGGSVLKEAEPDYLVNHPEEILGIVN